MKNLIKTLSKIKKKHSKIVKHKTVEQEKIGIILVILSDIATCQCIQNLQVLVLSSH